MKLMQYRDVIQCAFVTSFYVKPWAQMKADKKKNQKQK